MAKTVHWRGVDVDPITADMLTAIAKAAGDDIYVRGISGYGSYRSNAASGGTDSGGGHADLNMVGYSDEQCRRLETTARSFGAAAYFRPERRPDGTRYGWQRHVHVLRMDCADLSPAAKTQVHDYLAGYDGLYYGVDGTGNRIRKKDTGSRSHTGRRWLTLSASLGGPGLAPAKPTSVPKPVPKEDDMANVTDAQLKQLLDAAAKINASAGKSPRVLSDADGGQLRKDIGYVRDQLRKDLGYARDQILRALDPKALASAVVASLPTGQALTQDTVEAALRKVLGSLGEPDA